MGLGLWLGLKVGLLEGRGAGVVSANGPGQRDSYGKGVAIGIVCLGDLRGS